MQLISLLKSTILKAGITVKQSHGDANVMICKIALKLAEEGKAVQVSGTDTDLLVILMHHWKKNMELFFAQHLKQTISLRQEKRCCGGTSSVVTVRQH